MKSLRSMKGYTIIETMIFLVVSTALFGSAMALVGDQQDRAEFRYGIQEFTSQLRDISNDVATGYYRSPAETTCRVLPNGRPRFDGASTDQGANSDCIYVGRVMHFSPSGHGTAFDNNQVYRVYSVVGRREYRVSGSVYREVDTLQRSQPTLYTATQDTLVIPYGIEVGWIREGDGSGATTSAFGYFTNFADYVGESQTFETSARNTELVTFPGFQQNRTEGNLNNEVETATSANGDIGLTMCLEGFGYRVLVPIGTGASEKVEDLEIVRGTC